LAPPRMSSVRSAILGTGDAGLKGRAASPEKRKAHASGSRPCIARRLPVKQQVRPAYDSARYWFKGVGKPRGEAIEETATIVLGGLERRGCARVAVQGWDHRPHPTEPKGAHLHEYQPRRPEGGRSARPDSTATPRRASW